jgi:hypothetical protein
MTPRKLLLTPKVSSFDLMRTQGPLFALLSLFFIAGSIVLIFFVLLAGAVNGYPVSDIYFLQADTAPISGAPALSRWTFWNYCSVSPTGGNVIPFVTPAYPFDPQNNFGTQKGVAAAFIG